MKKKILMQIRDKKTLGIDTIFPIILIFAGLALSTISIFKNGVAREMSPFLFPKDSLLAFYNSKSALISDDTITKGIFDELYLPTSSDWKA